VSDVPVKVRLRGVAKQFMLRGKILSALAPVDLDIGSGEFLCLVGPSGCGKTTLLRILAGLERPSAGSVEVVRQQTEKPHSRPLNSMIFQEHGIFPWMTARQNVAFGLKARGIGSKERTVIADAFLNKVGLEAFADAYPHELSGGMKQRVSIARAFANDPEILLMDEPFAALDEQTKLLLQEELLRIWTSSKDKKTVVYVTHSLDEAIVLADRVLVMSHRPGSIKTHVDVARVFARPRAVQEVRSSPKYGELFGQLWTALRDEVTDPSLERRAAAHRKPAARE
jgi:NitT/TauT family transport system ATP-binding protein